MHLQGLTLTELKGLPLTEIKGTTMPTYRKDSKKLSAEVNADLKDAFRKQTRKRCQVNNDVVAAAIRIWMALPAGMQAEIISEPIDNILDYLRSRICPASGEAPHV